MDQALEAQVAEAAKEKLQVYSLLFVAIDGRLQAEEQKVDVRHSGKKTRVYVRWAVPASGLEFDPRNYHGARVPMADRTFDVVVWGANDVVVRAAMRCTHFAVGHEVDRPARARAIFECER